MDTIYAHSDSLIILASGSSINNKVELFKQRFPSYNVLAFGGSFAYMINTLKLIPTYVSYIDPYASIEIFDLILKYKIKSPCTLFVADPIITKSYSVQHQYIGNASGKGVMWETYYKTYLKRLKNIQSYCKVDKIPANSFKNIKYARYRELVKAGGQFLPVDEFRTILEDNTNDKMCIMEMWTVGRLTTYIFPLTYYLFKTGKFKYKRILLAGFDGYNPKFFRDSIPPREKILCKVWEKEYRFYLPMWVDIFNGFNTELLKITPSSSMECIKEICI